MTFADFASHLGMTLTSVPVGKHVVDGKTPFKWMCTLTYNHKEYSFEYTMGAAHVENSGGRKLSYSEIKKWTDKLWSGEITWSMLRPSKPELKDVLYCLHSDVTTVVDAPLWPDFASNLGMNEDSRKDYAIYEKCVDIHIKLRGYFYKEFPNFLECTEE